MPLTSAQRRDLKAQAHALKPVVQTGGQGLTDAVVQEIEIALAHHELIKVRLAGAERDERQDMTTSLAERLGAEVVGSIGAVVILYRHNPKKKRPR